jgi:penicillin G amidase
MKKILLRLFAGAGALVVLILAVIWLALRASLPQLDGSIDVDGLDGPAAIVRDDSGIPTITAASREDLAFATGFAHGQDRFFQMDLIRRQAAGELSELFGSVALGTDQRYRFNRFRTRAQTVFDLASPENRGVVERYADGVNAGLDSLGARPFEYLVLRKEPRVWLPEDSVVVVYAMFMQLNDSRARKDVRRGFAHRVLPAEVYSWLYPDGSPWDAPLMGEPRSVAPYPSPHQYAVRDWESEAPPTNEKGRPPLDGSNNWAVSGALTKTGRAMVSNDMHLGLSTPNIYYQARLVQSGDSARDITGVTLPGTPFVVAGSNGHVAWGYTNSYGDWTDAVIIQPGASPGTYRTPEGDREFITHTETIKIADAEAVDYSVRETVWGPIDEAANYPDGEIAVSWIAHKPDALNLQLIRLETVRTVNEALDIANTMGMPPQNFVTGDADGNIGWTIAGRIPIRTDFDPMLPSDWSKQHGWVGWREPSEYPRIVNPESGRIWSANSRVADGEALEIIGDSGYDLGARARQIRDALFAQDSFEPVDMLAIQYDDRALFLTPWRDLLLEVLDEDSIAGDDDLIEYRRLVSEWIPRASADSVGYRLVRGFRYVVRQRVFHGLMQPVQAAYDEAVNLRISNQFEAPLWQLLTTQPMHLLPGNYASWDELMIDSARENIAYLSENFEGPLTERSWGERNTAAIQHPMSRALPFLANWLDMPQSRMNGDSNMPKAQGATFGASERFSVSPGDEENGLMHMPTGQSGHPLSDFYRKGHDSWLNGESSPFWPEKAAHTLTLIPAGGTMDAQSE